MSSGLDELRAEVAALRERLDRIEGASGGCRCPRCEVIGPGVPREMSQRPLASLGLPAAKSDEGIAGQWADISAQAGLPPGRVVRPDGGGVEVYHFGGSATPGGGRSLTAGLLLSDNQASIYLRDSERHGPDVFAASTDEDGLRNVARIMCRFLGIGGDT